MTDITCAYPNREEALLNYLYDDGAPDARAAFQTHVALCAACSTELTQLRGVRRQLTQWEAPAVASLKSSVASPSLESSAPSPQSWWQEVPMWARAAAAVLCIGAAAGLANINVHYDQQGLSVRTGWLAPAVASPRSPVASQESPGVSPVAAAPWRDDLAAVENQLRTEFRSAGAPASPSAALVAGQPVALARSGSSMSDTEMLRRMRALVDESERKQERELALRVGQVLRDVNAQRQTDLRKIDSNLGVLQNNTGAEIMRQRQVQMNLMNYIVRTSDKK